MSEQTVSIRGMHCQMCVGRLTTALKGVPGVSGARVTLEPPRATVESERPVSEAALAAAVRSAGSYEIIPDEGVAGSGVEVVEPAKSLRPLFIIVGYITGVTVCATWLRGDGSVHTLMNDFMAGFFLVFSFFKMLDLPGFASAFRMYDPLARMWKPWAFVYPFVELGLGVAYLARWQPVLTSSVTLGLMLIGAAGVLGALRRKQAIRCACLGTVLNLPMTTVTLVEDLAMAAMAVAMLLWR